MSKLRKKAVIASRHGLYKRRVLIYPGKKRFQAGEVPVYSTLDPWEATAFHMSARFTHTS